MARAYLLLLATVLLLPRRPHIEPRHAGMTIEGALWAPSTRLAERGAECALDALGVISCSAPFFAWHLRNVQLSILSPLKTQCARPTR